MMTQLSEQSNGYVKSGWQRSIPFVLALTALYASSASADYSFEIISVPGSSSTQSFGINNAGKVTAGSDLGVFVYDLKTGEYTLISEDLSLLEINNSGAMVGNTVDGLCAIRDKHGTVTTFNPPSFDVDSFCQARGVNSKGDVSGFLIDASGGWLGFVHDPKTGNTEEFLPSGQTIAHAINAQGQNVGSVRLDADAAYPGSAEGRYGYMRQKNGSIKFVEVSQSLPGRSRLRGVSDSGRVTGFFVDSDLGEVMSFVTVLSSGTGFETITPTADQIVYQKPCNPDNATLPTGYELFTDVFSSQIRNDGVIVGSCTDYHFNSTTGDLIFFDQGFVATP